MTSTLVKPTTCLHCQGKGEVNSRMDFGRCWTCDGTGVVEGDKVTLAAAKERNVLLAGFTQAALDHSMAAHYGLMALQAQEPERAAKAFASFVAGRDDVLDALAAYFREVR